MAAEFLDAVTSHGGEVGDATIGLVTKRLIGLVLVGLVDARVSAAISGQALTAGWNAHSPHLAGSAATTARAALTRRRFHAAGRPARVRHLMPQRVRTTLLDRPKSLHSPVPSTNRAASQWMTADNGEMHC
jgi:hypothetical protein